MPDAPRDPQRTNPPQRDDQQSSASVPTVPERGPERVVFKAPWTAAPDTLPEPEPPVYTPQEAAPQFGPAVQVPLYKPTTEAATLLETAEATHPEAVPVAELQYVAPQETASLPENPHTPEPEAAPAVPEPAYASEITPAQGGWGILLLLSVQYMVVGVAQYWHAPIGAALLLAAALTFSGYMALLPYPMKLLREDSRWRTRPRLSVVLGGYLLGSLATGGMMLFGSSLWPAAISEVPHFLSKGGDQLALLLAAGLLIPLNEEIAFRGLLMRGLERARGPLFAALLSALLFAMGHGSPLQVLGILPLAWVLARAVQYTGSLWTSVGIHMLNNTVTTLVWMFLPQKLLDSALGGAALDTAPRIPLSMGLAGLLVSITAVSILTVWLKPKHAAPIAQPAPRVWTVSTLLILIPILSNVAVSLWRLLFAARPSTF